MNPLPSPIPATKPGHDGRAQCAGFGLGLRTSHYSDFLANKQPLDWLEIITDNFLVEGGKPLLMLDTIRRDYPIAMHGVAMSIGAAGGIDEAYVRKVKALARRVEPMWISDHLSWTGPGPEQLHDLYPLPYTDQAARHVIEQIQRTQDILQRQLVLENVSSYIDFKHNSASEWQFLAYIAERADCLLLVDVNNIYVSSVNHGFNPLDYLRALPAKRVQQMHLAGHADHGDYIVDTHDHPVASAVWDLYAQACQLFGPVATMIERDDQIPPLPSLIEELAIARDIAARVFSTQASATQVGKVGHLVLDAPAAPATQTLELAHLQRRIGDYILDLPEGEEPVIQLVREVPGVNRAQRLGIYHNAYRARLAEVLAENFSKTNLYMGSDTFNDEAIAFAVHQPPLARSLSRYGDKFPAFLAARYPENNELQELAQLDWDLRTRFDGPDVAALTAEAAQLSSTDVATWLSWPAPLHPSLILRPMRSNVTQIWRAIDADEEVPEVHFHEEAKAIVVWRKQLQPHFQTLDSAQAAFLLCLQNGQSIEEAANALAGSPALPEPQRLAGWLQAWLADGLLRLQTEPCPQ